MGTTVFLNYTETWTLISLGGWQRQHRIQGDCYVKFLEWMWWLINDDAGFLRNCDWQICYSQGLLFLKTSTESRHEDSPLTRQWHETRCCSGRWLCESGTHSVALSPCLYSGVWSNELWGRMTALNDWLEKTWTWTLCPLGFPAM